ncbi:DUF2268 domain-containing putative Zn-dependent protease [Virgibacillus halodenitrificans]|uniref:DUF2268 domain-containing protein n=1 Tax=Virgibacillus halodenitrificans TaxID=1482 RepID=UPI0024C0AE16|nr:DUF2268 domain-containing putative Zn-dependent protease [Virgibacillus halodenitrificans]WHX28088.1 DUF2268 domain-containing putative Zn-dependent protease [Virgibacillus halodenitrificans]
MKKLPFLLLLILIALTACSYDSANPASTLDNNKKAAEQSAHSSATEGDSTKEEVPSSFSFTYIGQKFEVVYYYKSFLQYIEKAEQQPKNLNGTYIETIINPIAEERGVRLSKGWGFGTPTQPDLLAEYLQSLIENQDTIHKIITDSLKKSANELQPGADKYVYVFPANPEDKDVMESVVGVSAFTWNENFISLQIAPPFFNESSLKQAVAHEYHHTVLFENNELGYTLLESVLIEGKADTFAKIIYPEIQMPWSYFSSEENESQTWEVLKENMTSAMPSIQDEFFLGNTGKGLPQWANYKIGNKIMDSFIEENPNITIDDWTDMPANEILEKSKYAEKH